MSVPSQTRDQAVHAMFDRIAGRYDLLNRVISCRFDGWWRKQAIAEVLTGAHPLIVDLGTGTGDMAYNAAHRSRGNARIIGLDFSMNMLALAQAKRRKTAAQGTPSFVQGSAMTEPFKASVFDGAMTAFVLRNVSDLELFFAEAHRVLKPGAKMVSLDMFPPSNRWFAPFYGIYFYRLVPWIGGLLSEDRHAYRYLSDSVRGFHSPETIADMIRAAGFAKVAIRKYLCGAVCMHIAEKADG